MTELRTSEHNPVVRSQNEHFGRYFGLFSLTGNISGVLSIFIRLRYEKHYTLYERRAFPSSREAGRYLQSVAKDAQMFVIRPEF